MDNYISINNLSKVYSNKFHAINNLNLNIKKGEIFALLGPNGAGKSTLINIICGIVSLTSGTVKVNNFDIISEFRKTTILGLQLATWDNIGFRWGVSDMATLAISTDIKRLTRATCNLNCFDTKGLIINSAKQSKLKVFNVIDLSSNLGQLSKNPCH